MTTSSILQIEGKKGLIDRGSLITVMCLKTGVRLISGKEEVELSDLIDPPAFLRLKQWKIGGLEPNVRGFINLCQEVNMDVEEEPEEGGGQEVGDGNYEPQERVDYDELVTLMRYNGAYGRRGVPK